MVHLSVRHEMQLLRYDGIIKVKAFISVQLYIWPILMHHKWLGRDGLLASSEVYLNDSVF